MAAEALEVQDDVVGQALGALPLLEHLDPAAMPAAAQLALDRAREVQVAPALGLLPVRRADLDAERGQRLALA